MEFLELLQTGRPVLLDGGMGTMLQAKGLPVGATPELTALDHPEWLLDIHRAYVEAGAQILYANTFGANREKLSHCGKTVEEIVPAPEGMRDALARHVELVETLKREGHYEQTGPWSRGALGAERGGRTTRPEVLRRMAEEFAAVSSSYLA